MHAYVLHSRRYRDSSLLLELLTREQGRLACIARGALRPRGAGASLQPFQALQVALRGRGEVATLTRAEPLGAPLALGRRRLYCGLYLNELLQRLTAREDPLPALFDDYAAALAALRQAAALEPVLRGFEVALLAHLGVGIRLDRDVHGDPIRPERRYAYDIDRGARPVDGGTGDAVQGATLGALRSGDFADRRQLDEARRLMRQLIAHQLGGQPLKSRELFQ